MKFRFELVEPQPRRLQFELCNSKLDPAKVPLNLPQEKAAGT
jgi:hypothetical protein